ncbi:MAG: FkbM family methyltransferase [Spirochaetaceae bacterium]|jgi:hypothetical protein|nr:FkbM family methyltransferase [Spirochaetaceae bacterium]
MKPTTDNRQPTTDNRQPTTDNRQPTTVAECIKAVYRVIVPAFLRTELLRFRNYELYLETKAFKKIADPIKKKVIKYLKAECARSGDREKKEILNYLKLNKNLMFPYTYTEKYTLKNISAYTDPSCGMNYVLHEEKKLYFPKSFSIKQTQQTYNALLSEQDADSPHCYKREGFCVEDGNVIADVGCAEAIWALSNAERASKIYLFECEETWIEALHKTFEPWKEKVVIVNKYISNKSDGVYITLDDFLNGTPVHVVKADIEGAEPALLEGAKNTLRQGNLKLLLCTYHHANDARDIEAILSQNEYQIEYSKGYMIFIYDEHLAPPYLRKALIYAKK